MDMKVFTLKNNDRMSDFDIHSATSLCLPDNDGRRVLLVVPDHTRKFSRFESTLLNCSQKKYGKDMVDIAIATGMHRQSTLSEALLKWGSGVLDCEIFQNNPNVRENTVDKLKRNENYFVIAYSNPLPHNHVGMSGGFKLLMPGFACLKDTAYFHGTSREAALSMQEVFKNAIDYWIGCAYDHHGYVLDLCFAEKKYYFDQWVLACRNYYKVEIPKELPDVALLTPRIKDADFILAMNSLLVAKDYPIVREGGVIAIEADMTDGIGVHYLFQKPNGAVDIYYDKIFEKELRNSEFHVITTGATQRAMQRFFDNKYVVVHENMFEFQQFLYDMFEGHCLIHNYIAPEMMIGEQHATETL